MFLKNFVLYFSKAIMRKRIVKIRYSEDNCLTLLDRNWKKQDLFFKLIAQGHYYNHETNTFDHYLLGPTIHQDKNGIWYIVKKGKRKNCSVWQKDMEVYVKKVKPHQSQYEELKKDYIGLANKLGQLWKKPTNISTDKNIQMDKKVKLKGYCMELRQFYGKFRVLKKDIRGLVFKS